jgi:hypothetical protein
MLSQSSGRIDNCSVLTIYTNLRDRMQISLFEPFSLDLSCVLPFAVFNQKTLYDAYKKRAKNIEVDMETYNKAKETDPEFYRDASSLQYGKVLQ